MSNFVLYFVKKSEGKTEFAILQEVYAIFGSLSFLMAAVIGLFHQALGVGLLIVPLVVFCALGLNIVSWALIKLAVETIAKTATKQLANDKTTKKTSVKKSGRSTKSK